MSNLLEQLGFTPVGPKRRRLFISSEGETGTGKTHFLRTMPGPIAVINFDHGLEGSAEFDVHGRPIMQKSIDVPDFDESGKTMTQGERQTALKSYEQFRQLVEQLIRSSKQPGGIRTLAIDTGTAGYTLAQAARFGRIAQVGEVPPNMWTAMQQEFENIFSLFESHDCNLYVTHRQGSKFKGLVGEKELKGYKQMQYVAQIHLAFGKKVTRLTDPVTQAVSLQHDLTVEVVKCRQRLALEGTLMQAFWLDANKEQSIGTRFVDIAMAIFPGSTEQDWIG